MMVSGHHDQLPKQTVEELFSVDEAPVDPQCSAIVLPQFGLLNNDDH